MSLGAADSKRGARIKDLRGAGENLRAEAIGEVADLKEALSGKGTQIQALARTAIDLVRRFPLSALCAVGLVVVLYMSRHHSRARPFR
jgi:hypothetical protein